MGCCGIGTFGKDTSWKLKPIPKPIGKTVVRCSFPVSVVRSIPSWTCAILKVHTALSISRRDCIVPRIPVSGHLHPIITVKQLRQPNYRRERNCSPSTVIIGSPIYRGHKSRWKSIWKKRIPFWKTSFIRSFVIIRRC